MEIKFLNMFAVKEKKNPKMPDYRIMATINDKLEEVGIGYKKLTKKGDTYLSCSLKGNVQLHYVVDAQPAPVEKSVQLETNTEDIPF